MSSYRNAIQSALLAATVTLAGCGWMSSMMGSSSTAMTSPLTGASEVPPVSTTGSGTVNATFNKETNVLTWRVSYSGLSGPVTAGHIHGPAMTGANAGVMIPFTGSVASPFEGKATLTAAQVADLMAGRLYVNLHTAKHPGGEVRAQLTPGK